MNRLTIGGAHVLFVATEPPGSALEPNCPVWCQTWRRFLVQHYRDIGRHWNAILERYARAHPNRTSFISITNLVCHDDAVPCDDRVQGKPARYDGTHYTDQTAPIVVGAIVNELAAIIAARRY